MAGNFDEYETLDALALADLVRRKEIGSKEVLQRAIDLAEARNPALNAIVTKTYDAAFDTVDKGLSDGPFAGVPYLFKELVVTLTGVPTTFGSRLYADGTIPDHDSEIVARCKRAGLIAIGKTNTSEFGLQPVTEPHLFGPAQNPWRSGYSPGGSSGGSAAAVAAGIVPMAHATDGGGSIRIPASCCGLFGLKPTRARITAGPDVGEGMAGLAAQHVVSRTVRDSAALLDATAGPLPGDPYFAAAPPQSYLSAAMADPEQKLRIAFSTTAPNGAKIDPKCVEATVEAARLCEALGHVVEEAMPDFDVEAVERGFTAVFQANTMVNIARKTGGGLPEPGMVEPLTMAIAECGQSMLASDYIAQLQVLQRETRKIADFFERHNIWLTPTLATPPPEIGKYDSDITDIDLWMRRLMAFIPFTYLFNVTGQPAMSLPFWQTPDGLPVGCHFAGRYGDEATLFALAGQIERARPWRQLAGSLS